MLAFVGRAWHFLKWSSRFYIQCLVLTSRIQDCVDEWNVSFCFPSTSLSIPEIVNQTLGYGQRILWISWHAPTAQCLKPLVWSTLSTTAKSSRIYLLHCWHTNGIWHSWPFCVVFLIVCVLPNLYSFSCTAHISRFRWSNISLIPRCKSLVAVTRKKAVVGDGGSLPPNGSWNSCSTCRIYSRRCWDQDTNGDLNICWTATYLCR